jgi:Flp pilus assembly protein TadD
VLSRSATLTIASADGSALPEGQYRVRVGIDRSRLSLESGGQWLGDLSGGGASFEVRPVRDEAEQRRHLALQAEAAIVDDPEAALSRFLELHKVDHRYGTTIGRLLRRLGRHAEAIAVLEEARSDDPYDWIARDLLVASYIGVGNLEAAELILRHEKGMDDAAVAAEIARLQALSGAGVEGADLD